MNEKVLVKKIKTDYPLTQVAFCADGHTVACAGTGLSNEGVIVVYDLRKSS